MSSLLIPTWFVAALCLLSAALMLYNNVHHIDFSVFVSISARVYLFMVYITVGDIQPTTERTVLVRFGVTMIALSDVMRHTILIVRRSRKNGNL